MEANLPEECAIASDDTLSFLTTGSAKKKKRVNNELMEALRDYNTASMGSEVAKQKLVYMEKEDARREVEETRLEEEHIQKKEEHIQKKHRSMLDEWERMQANIRSLRVDLRDELLDSESKREIQEDIAALVKRKNELAIELGFK